MTTNGSADYAITRSLRFQQQVQQSYLRRTLTQTGDLQKMTFSFWYKPGLINGSGAGGNSNSCFVSSYRAGTISSSFTINSAIVTVLGNVADYDSLGINFQSNQANAAPAFFINNAGSFRDISSWYHIVVAIDTTQATAANRIRIYSNNVELTYNISTTITQNSYLDTWNTSGNTQAIGALYNPDYGSGAGYASAHKEMCLADFYFIDGQQLTPISFGQYSSTTGVWRPNNYQGTYGTNGFHLTFDEVAQTTSSNAGLGKDTSGNGNYFITSGFTTSSTTVSDYASFTDVPTLKDSSSSNYPVLNALVGAPATGTSYSIYNNNLTMYASATGSSRVIEIPATMPLPSTGIYYWEIYIADAATAGTYPLAIGISSQGGGGLGTDTSFANNHYYYIPKTGNKVVNKTASAYGAASSNGDYVSVLFNATDGKLTFFRNGNGLGDITGISTTTTWYPKFATNDYCTIYANFGQRPFYGYDGSGNTLPAGVSRLNAYNTPAPTIINGAAHMAITKYSSGGAGGSITVSNAVNNVSFLPDLIWLRNYSFNYYFKALDTVRGTGKSGYIGTTGVLDAQEDRLTTTSSGFIVTAGTAGDTYNAGTSSSNYIAYQWKASGGTTSSIAVNAYGSPTPSIASTVSVNTTAKFSIVTYTGNGTAGATVGHGFAGTAPSMIIVKQRTPNSTDWAVYHTTIGNTATILLSSTNAATAASATYWNNTTPGSNAFTLGTGATVNTLNSSYVAYCWAAVAGYSAFGSYTGNNNANGPFVNLNFRPRFIMIKNRTTAPTNWAIVDTGLSQSFNPTDKLQYLNTGAYVVDAKVASILSNGFQIKVDATSYGNNDFNKLNDVYIYAAFAENPFKYADAR